MTKYVNVNLFDVSWDEDSTQWLTETLLEYSRLPMQGRWRDDLRLENIDVCDADETVPSRYFVLNFVKKRPIGPGRVAAGVPVADIGLNVGEEFGEETAALYLPSQRWLLVLHNQYGVGPSRMAEYFNALDPGNAARHFSYRTAPCIDRQAIRRMEQMRNFTSVEVIASVGAFDNSGAEVGESVQEAAQAARAMRVSLKFEANEVRRKGNSLNFNEMTRLIGSLLNRGEDVRKLEVKGAENAETADQIVDLIEHKIRARRNASELVVANHRYTFASKKSLLQRVCRGWMNTLI